MMKMSGAYRSRYDAKWPSHGSMCHLVRSRKRLGPQRSFGRALDVDQSQIGGSLSNVVVMGKVVLRYLNDSVACG